MLLALGYEKTTEAPTPRTSRPPALRISAALRLWSTDGPGPFGAPRRDAIFGIPAIQSYLTEEAMSANEYPALHLNNVKFMSSPSSPEAGLDGPSRTIIVEPVELPDVEPIEIPEVSPEREQEPEPVESKYDNA